MRISPDFYQLLGNLTSFNINMCFTRKEINAVAKTITALLHIGIRIDLTNFTTTETHLGLLRLFERNLSSNLMTAVESRKRSSRFEHYSNCSSIILFDRGWCHWVISQALKDSQLEEKLSCQTSMH